MIILIGPDGRAYDLTRGELPPRTAQNSEPERKELGEERLRTRGLLPYEVPEKVQEKYLPR
jgi:hypothetical protein